MRTLADGTRRVPATLLHRHAFGQIARLIDIAAAGHRNVIRQKLQWDHRDDRLQVFLDGRDFDNVVGQPRRLWQRKWKDGRSILSVELTNSTAEPDGTRRNFFIGVHPECRPMRRREDGSIDLGEPQKLTALNAVASTFGKTGSEYWPAVDT